MPKINPNCPCDGCRPPAAMPPATIPPATVALTLKLVPPDAVADAINVMCEALDVIENAGGEIPDKVVSLIGDWAIARFTPPVNSAPKIVHLASSLGPSARALCKATVDKNFSYTVAYSTCEECRKIATHDTELGHLRYQKPQASTEKPAVASPEAPAPIDKVAERAFAFLCGLNLQDHSVTEQREHLDIVRDLKAALKKEPQS